MARTVPGLPKILPANLGEAAEYDTVRRLANGLPDAYVVFHSVDWSTGSGPAERHGEIDVVVVNQAGELMLLEVKSGLVDFQADGIFKRYKTQTRSVTAQIGSQYAAMRARMQSAGLEARLHTLLVLPDMQVQSETVQWPRERIVDCDQFENLPSIVAQQLGAGVPDERAVARVSAFLEDRLSLAPDVTALGQRLQEQTTRLSSGLATWVPRIAVPSGLVRVVATAGSGKTQLALRMLRDANLRGQRAAYVCFNRALADHMSRLVPTRVVAETFHELAVRVARGEGMTVDFAAPGVFDAVAGQCVAALSKHAPDLDFIVLDEVQDLQPAWVESMLMRLRREGRALLLEDPSQQLYPDREPFELPDAVTVTSMDNFRTPRQIVGLINLLRLTETPVDASSAHDGEVPDPIVYADDRECLKGTEKAVQRCLDRGFAIDEVAVVSMRGRGHSLMLNADRLGSWALRRFDGRYDASGAPQWTQGELLVESVRRFKGQAAPAVVFTECDFEALDSITKRLVFVGLTRARMHLEWVVSERAASAINRAVAT